MPTETAEATIVGMERAMLDRSDAGDPFGFVEISDPEVSYFDPFLEQAIHGRDALEAYYRRVWPAETGRGEMSNAKVQVAGDMAVLTFNYTSHFMGKVNYWNTTEVYRLGAEGWRILHTHWALRQPLPVEAK